MPRTSTILEILIASPSDVVEERRLLVAVFEEWNVAHGRSRGCVLQPVLWETHSTPEYGDRPQAIINRRLVDACDGLVGAFWTRLGTPTGDALSGTVEEINRIRDAKKPVMLYFSTREPVLESIDTQQLDALRAFRKDCQSRSLY